MNISLKSNGSLRTNSDRLRIAQIAPLYEATPPKFYGGTERVVSHITEELVRRGHHVTLFAAGDSVTSGKLEPGHPLSLRAARKSDSGVSGVPFHLPMLSDAYSSASSRFDIIHTH